MLSESLVGQGNSQEINLDDSLFVAIVFLMLVLLDHSTRLLGTNLYHINHNHHKG